MPKVYNAAELLQRLQDIDWQDSGTDDDEDDDADDDDKQDDDFDDVDFEPQLLSSDDEVASRDDSFEQEPVLTELLPVTPLSAPVQVLPPQVSSTVPAHAPVPRYMQHTLASAAKAKPANAASVTNKVAKSGRKAKQSLPLPDQPAEDRTSKDAVTWYRLEPGEETAYRKRFDYKGKEGPKRYARNRVDHTALSAFTCLLDYSMLESIVKYTNKEAERSEKQQEAKAKINNKPYKSQNFRIDINRLLAFCCQTTFNLPKVQ